MEGGIVSIEGKAVIDLGQYRSIRRVKGGIMGVPVGGKSTDVELIFEGNEDEVSQALKKIEEVGSWKIFTLDRFYRHSQSTLSRKWSKLRKP